MYAIDLVNQYMEELKQEYFMTVKQILRYIKGSTNYELLYTTSYYSRSATHSDCDEDPYE